MLVVRQHSVLHPDVDKGRRHREPLGHGLYRHQAIRALAGLPSMQRAGRFDRMLLAHGMHPRIRPGLAGSGEPALGVESFRNPVVGERLRQFAQPGDHRGLGAAMPAQGWAMHLMLRGHAAAPDDSERSAPFARIDLQHHFRDNQPQHTLAVHVGRGRGVPERRQVLGEAMDEFLVGLVQRQQFGPAHDRVFLLQLFKRLQGRVPAGLKGAGNQAVLRLDRVVLALGPLRLVAGALDPQLPLAIKCLVLVLERGKGGQSGFDRRGPDRLQEQCRRSGSR